MGGSETLSEKRLIINVGLHKTGTTFLNRSVFPELPNSVHLGKPFGATDPVRLVLEQIMYSPYTKLDVECARKAARDLLSNCNADTVTISDGRLSQSSRADRYLIAERLRQVFGPAEILISLRRQQDLLLSLYYQALGTRRAPVKYPEWVQQFRYHGGKMEFDLLNYFVLVDAYAAAFGKDHVHVFLYEQLREDRRAYAERLAGVLCIEAEQLLDLIAKPAKNVRMSKAHAALLHYPAPARLAMNVRSILPKRLLGVAQGALQLSGSASGRLPPELAESSMEIPRETNRLLMEKYSAPLEGYGYPL